MHTTHLSYREHEGRKREDQVLFIDKVVAAHKNDNVQVADWVTSTRSPTATRSAG